MHIKSIVAGAAIAFAATIGSASAADQFATLDGITAQPLTAADMGSISGRVITITVVAIDPSTPFVTVLDARATGAVVAPGSTSIAPPPPQGP